MKFKEAREKLEQTLEKYKNSISLDGVTVVTDINYQTDEWDDCVEDDKRLRFMAGEIFFKHKDIPEEQTLGFSMIVDCKSKNKISERELISEINGFSESVDKLLAELSGADDIRAQLVEYSERADEESRALMDEFNEQMKKINRNLDIIKITTIVIAVVGIIAVILTNLLK